MTVIPNFGEDQLYVLIELFINGIGVIEEKPSFITRNWQYLGIPQEPDPELEEEEPDATEEQVIQHSTLTSLVLESAANEH